MPDSRRASSLIRSPRPPASTAACITRSRANATPNSCPKRHETRVFSPAGGRSCARSRADPSAACKQQRRLARDERRLGLLEPRHRLAGLARQRDEARPAARPAAPRPAPPRSAGARSWRFAARAKKPLRRRAVAAPPRRRSTHMPRPGSRPARSGTTSSSGPATKRISPAFGPVSRVTMQRRSGSSRSFTRPPRVTRLRPGPPPRPRPRPPAPSALLGLRRHEVGRVDPAELDAGVHDQRLRLLEAHVELLEQALVLDPLAVDGGVAAGELPVGAAGEVLERLDAVLGQRLDHLRRQPLEVEQALLDAELAGVLERLGVDLLEALAGAGLQLLGGVLVEAVDRGELVERRRRRPPRAWRSPRRPAAAPPSRRRSGCP